MRVIFLVGRTPWGFRPGGWEIIGWVDERRCRSDSVYRSYALQQIAGSLVWPSFPLVISIVNYMLKILWTEINRRALGRFVFAV